MVAVLEVISPKVYYLPITTVVILKFNRTFSEKDYLADGFGPINGRRIAKRRFDCYFMVKIEDVTTQILEGTATLANEADKQKKFKKTSPD
jgi:hypothetical protein